MNSLPYWRAEWRDALDRYSFFMIHRPDISRNKACKKLDIVPVE